MKKRIGFIMGLLICVLVVGRIVFVNVTYPYAGIRQKEQEDTMSYGGAEYSIQESKLYAKDKWLNYIDSMEINEEAKENHVMHTGTDDSENINNYDYYVGYNPEVDYQVLVLKLHFQNLDMEEKELERSFSVVRKVNAAQEFYDAYYSEELQTQMLENSTVGEEGGKSMIQVYMISKDMKHLYLQSLEFGNNTIVRLKPEIVE